MSQTLHDEEDRYQILASSSLTLSGARVLKHGDTFAVFDRFGDIRALNIQGAQGLYHDGTRFLSTLRIRVGGKRPLLLSSAVRDNNVLLAVDMMNPDIARGDRVTIPHGTLHVFRSAFLWRGSLYERVQLGNFADAPVAVAVAVDFDADFVDVFEVRGTHRERRGSLHPALRLGRGLVLSYTGLDDTLRSLHLDFAPAPDEIGDGYATFHVDLQSKQHKDLYVTASCEVGPRKSVAVPAFENAYSDACVSPARSSAVFANISTENELFNDWIARSMSDLRMMISDTPHGPYPYAGVPWYSTPFGRDGLITALESLWVCPGLARGVLSFLADFQATESDPERDAEPGKILHEMRGGEMAILREIPFERYYGSVDSTPLFVMLAAAYYEATADRGTLEKLWPNVEAALGWIDACGDLDGDGFVEYARRSHDGLVQQGWKDSQDSVFHADGSAAEGSIALCEVQGYVYAAKLGAARLARALGNAARALELEAEAESLRARFDEAFWLPELSTYALALDGEKRPCRVLTSNAGHSLYTGIALPERAPLLAAKLLGPESFSGWGIRTLATSERRYNPMSYHNGTVWPHDNALIAAGLARYGLKSEASVVLTALFDATLALDLSRLPELFCGFPRRPGEGPTHYPVACAPQAWAAAVPFLLLQSVLGADVDAVSGKVAFDHPVLPACLAGLALRELRVGDATIDLRIERYPADVGIEVNRRLGHVSVVLVK